MPLYNYKCPVCFKQQSILHSMSECDEPNEDTILKTTCNPNTCEAMKHDESGVVYGTQWNRIPQPTSFLQFGQGDLNINNGSGTLSKAQKLAAIDKRANTHVDKREKESKEHKDREHALTSKKIAKGDHEQG